MSTSPSKLRHFQFPGSMAIIVLAAVLFGTMLMTVTRLQILPDLQELPTMQGSGDTLREAIVLLLASLTLVASRPLSFPLKVLDIPASLLLLLAWCAATLSWAIAPEIGLRRLILAVLIIWMAFRAVDELGHRRSMAVVLYGAVMVLLTNLTAVALIPRAIHQGYGVLPDPSIIGAWRGILTDKNAAGLLTGVTILLLVFGVGRFRSLVRILLIVCAVVFLAGTHSKTSIGATAFSVTAGFLFRFFVPRRRGWLILSFFFALPAIVYSVGEILPSSLMVVYTDPQAFTGRAEIWVALLAFVRDHLWFGAGYQSFWNVGMDSPIYGYSSKQWIVQGLSSGHNGYLDLATQIGVIGLSMALLVLFVLPLCRLLASVSIPPALGALQFSLLVLMLIDNFTESTMLVPDQFGELLLILSIACIRDMSRERTSIVGRQLPTKSGCPPRALARLRVRTAALDGRR